MHAHRVDVLDRADDHHVVALVAHQLQLELFPAEYRLLEQNLAHWARVKARAGDAIQIGRRPRDARPSAAERKRWPDHDWIAQVSRSSPALRQRVGDPAGRDLGADTYDDVLELISILAGPDR